MIDSLVEQQVERLERFIQKKEEYKATHPLRYLFWETTLRCNMQCLHCGSDCVCDNSTQSDELSVDKIKDELQSIAQVYDPTTITFAMIGGEPLLRKDEVCQVGAYAARLGYHWGIVTNGMLLDDDTIRQLKQAGLQTISVSLDGLEREHDALRNRPGAYERVISTIERLLDERFFQRFDVICCISKLNIHTLEEFVEQLRRLGVPAIRFVPVFARGRTSQHSELVLDNQDYVRLLRFVATQRKGQSDIRINLSEEGYWGPEWEGKVRDNLHYCGAGILVGSILYNGDVIGCPSMSRTFVEGNVKEVSFVDIWQRGFGLYRQGRRALFAEQCGDCEHWVLCEGGGLHLLQQSGVPEDQCSLRKVSQGG
ncbi:MAG: radical SAM protein [Chloroflexi bacterium]|nr:radical SAM protein [Chloroflexota bacterium]